MTSTTSATTANTTVPTPFSCSDSSGWRGRRDSSNSASCSKCSILALASSCSRRISSSRRACSPLGSRMQSKYSCPGANRCTGSVRCCFLRYSFITPKVTTFPPNPTTPTPQKNHQSKILPPPPTRCLFLQNFVLIRISLSKIFFNTRNLRREGSNHDNYGRLYF